MGWFEVTLLIGVAGAAVGLLVLRARPEESSAGADAGGTRGSRSPRQMLERAEQRERDGDWDGALSCWNQYLQRRPGDGAALLRRGVLRYKLNETDGACQDLDRAEQRLEDPPVELQLYRARSRRKTGQPEAALGSYDQYLRETNSPPSVALEAGECALEAGIPERGVEYFDSVRDDGSGSPSELMADGSSAEAIDATLGLIRCHLRQERPEAAQPFVQQLFPLMEDEVLSRRQSVWFDYCRGLLFEQEGKPERAREVFRDLHRRVPEFEDLQDRMQREWDRLSRAERVQRYLRLSRSEFLHLSERLTESLGFEVVGSDSTGSQETVVKAYAKGNLRRITRVVLTFKQWEDPAARFPLKEFELRLVEGRFDRGFFVTPGGFKPGVEEYATRNPRLTLLGPDELLKHLRDVDDSSLI